MIQSRPLDKLLFLDIETTSQYPTYESMPPQAKDLFFRRWEKDIWAKADELFDPQSSVASLNLPVTADGKYGLQRALEEIYNTKGPLHAEWNKVICISMGSLIIKNPAQYTLVTVSISNADEPTLLNTFLKVAKSITDVTKAAQATSDDSKFIVAHNGLIFDLPVLAKRMIYNKIEPPFMFRLFGLKPWDVKWVIDTKEYWKCGVFDAGANVSMDQLAYNFGVPSSKSVMQGKDVKNVYYLEKDLPKIETYCEADVYALAQCYCRMMLNETPIIHQKMDVDKVIASIDAMAAKAVK